MCHRTGVKMNVLIIDLYTAAIFEQLPICMTGQFRGPRFTSCHFWATETSINIYFSGVVTYALLTGRLPYTVEPFKISALYKKMMNGEMNPIPSTLSKNCRDFILKVLTPNPDKRPTVDEIIEHKWLKESLDYKYVFFNLRTARWPCLKTMFSYLVGVNERIIEDEESRTLNSDVIRILTTSLGKNQCWCSTCLVEWYSSRMRKSAFWSEIILLSH